MTAPVRYEGWTRDRQGWLFGLSGAAWVSVLGTAIPLLLAVGAHAWPVAVAWLPVWALVVLLTVVPVRGRSAFRWLADALAHTFGGIRGWTAWQSRAAAGTIMDLTEPDLPGVLSGIRVHDGPPLGAGQQRPALVADAREHAWAVVATLTHPGIGLAEASVRARMGAGLAELLEGAAASDLISRVALQVRTLPDDGAERAAWCRTHLRADAPPLALAADEQCLVAVTAAGVRHETFLTVVVPEARLARQARQAGGGVDGRARVLYALMAQVEARLLGPVGCSRVAWLDSPELAAAIRTGFAPGDRANLVTARMTTRPGDMNTGLPLAVAGPSSAPAPQPRHYVHDAWCTVSCTVLLPDKGAVMGALAPVLTPATVGERRTVSVLIEPVPGPRGARLVGGAAMSSELAGEVRRRAGFRTRAADRRDADRVEGQDVQLAQGNALLRVAVVAAVTVPSGWPIDEYGRSLEASITASGFTPLRLDLAQDSGFAAACIPLGVGLPRRRGAR